MFFTVLSTSHSIPVEARSQAFLIIDNWDDWFKFTTMYYLYFVDENGDRHSIGSVKIGQFDMPKDQSRAAIPDSFDALGEEFFSLGQDESYYDDLNRLGSFVREKILTGLRDFALDLELFERAKNEKVTGVSLLRSVPPATVQRQFHRMALGGARLSRYKFSYKGPKNKYTPISVSFTVEPESQPPTNIHVLIGRNGVGKTYLLNQMTRALVEEDSDASEIGEFVSEDRDPDEFDDLSDTDNRGAGLFSNIVSVTFSAFDPFEPLPIRRDKTVGVQYCYIGLKRTGTDDNGRPLPPKAPKDLSREFSESIRICRKGVRAARWRRALEMLETDPNFKDAEIAQLAGIQDDELLKKQALSLFSKLSSGHKIVLLTITRLVETVEERTLVLLDEPEAHLHPPLLSAFVRSLSDLLVNRNGVAIVATHSPVLLQEVPKSCVWQIERTGRNITIVRPEKETFGENVGVLTRGVFGLEVTHAGFHQLLRESINQEENPDYESVLRDFGGELGAEAKAIIRALIAARNAGDTD